MKMLASILPLLIASQVVASPLQTCKASVSRKETDKSRDKDKNIAPEDYAYPLPKSDLLYNELLCYPSREVVRSWVEFQDARVEYLEVQLGSPWNKHQRHLIEQVLEDQIERRRIWSSLGGAQNTSCRIEFRQEHLDAVKKAAPLGVMPYPVNLYTFSNK